METFWKRSFLLFLVALVALFAALFSLRDYLSNRQQVMTGARDHARIETRKAITAINQNLEGINSTAQILADNLASGRLHQNMIPTELRKILSDNPQIAGIGVAYIPHIHAADIRTNTPYYAKRSNAGDPDAAMRIQLFTIPFSALIPSTHDTIIKGIVFVDYSLQDLKDMVNGIDMGATGYGYIVSKKGRFLAHPVDQYVKNQKNIFTEAELQNDRPLKELAEYAAQGNSGLVDYTDPQTGFPYWICYEPIPLTGWYMMGLFINERILTWSPSLQHKLIRSTLAWIVCLVCLYALFTALQQNHRINYSGAFAFMGFLLFCAICFFYYLVHAGPNDIQKKEVVVSNKAGISRFLNNNLSKLKAPLNDSALFIPTGVYIKSVLLGGEGKTTITGTIWQSYDVSIPESVSKGAIISNAKSMKMNEIYRTKAGDRTIIGWDFEGMLDQRFEYPRYPLDRTSLRLEIQHKEFTKNIVLVPDIGAYTIMNPAFKPGVNSDIHMAGWTVEESYFSYLFNDAKTNFGIDGYIKNELFPILNYTIFIKRQFINAFIGYMLPPFVVCFILFAMLTIISEFSTTQLIGSCSSIFFVVVLNHIRLRGEIMASEIIYLEYFYFILYLAILIIISMSVIINSHPNKKILQARYGPISKMIYWPSILALILAITIRTYFN